MYHKDGGGSPGCGSGIAWCSSFVCWCIEQTGYKGLHSAGSRIFLTNDDVEKCDPFYGAVAVFSDCNSDGTKIDTKGHATFIFGKISGNNYACLGGNQGDMLKISKYDCSGQVFISYVDKKGVKHYKKFRGFYKPKEYIIKKEDLLSSSDNYSSADEVNLKLGIKVKSSKKGESSR